MLESIMKTQFSVDVECVLRFLEDDRRPERNFEVTTEGITMDRDEVCTRDFPTAISRILLSRKEVIASDSTEGLIRSI